MDIKFCVNSGFSRGTHADYAVAAKKLGRLLAQYRIGLIHGGGRVGLMGIVADAVLADGRRVIGVIAESLATKEIAHDGLSEPHIEPTYTRKALMAQHAGAFLTLPGGIGTFEDFCEILSWATFGLHEKLMGILNIGAYFDPLIALLDHAIAARFALGRRQPHLTMASHRQSP